MLDTLVGADNGQKLLTLKARIRKVFHFHQWKSTIGTGLYDDGYRNLAFYPVIRKQCEVCGKIKDVIGRGNE